MSFGEIVAPAPSEQQIAPPLVMDQKVKSVPPKSSDDYVKGMAIYDTEEVS